MFDDTQIKQIYGKRVRARRKELGWTILELIAKVETIRPDTLSRSSLINLENGKASIKVTSLICVSAIAYTLSVNPLWLIGMSNEKFTSENDRSFPKMPQQIYAKAGLLDVAEKVSNSKINKKVIPVMMRIFDLTVRHRERVISFFSKIAEMSDSKRNNLITTLEDINSLDVNERNKLLEIISMYKKFSTRKKLFLYHTAQNMTQDL